MIIGNGASKWALLGGVSVIAALAGAAAAQAACTTADGSVTCTGDNAPFTVTSDAPTIIAPDATVTGSGLSAIRLNSTRANLRIDGTISATGAAALTIQNGERELVLDPNAGASPLRPYVYPYYYPAGRATIIVGEQGTITGDTGIWIERSSINYLGDSTATIDNSGLITATSGSAIRGPATTGIGYTIINRESGTIHGIAAVASISNAGLIDGRGEDAVTILPSNDPYFGGPARASIGNSGTITSAAAATIVSQQNYLNLTNSGTIVNTNGGRSIDVGNGLALSNSGTIEGNIVVRAGGSTIDSTKGTIKGDVLLGSGDDIIVAAIDPNGQLRTGITGLVDGGAGLNTVSLTVSNDATLTGTPVLPTNFAMLRMYFENKAELTLDAAFAGTSRIYAWGSGTLINRGRIATQGRAIEAMGTGYPTAFNLVNEGVIKANLASTTDAAVSIDGAAFTNKGDIEAVGGAGILLKSGSGTMLVNSGTISATGAPAVLFGGGYASNATLENKAGGVIRGNTVAIAVLPDSSPYSYGSTTITNAGSIVGHVDLTGSGSTDRFIMQQGGSVTGDVRLGGGNDSYIFDGAMGANGFLTGISGALDGGEGSDQLLARIKDDVAITLGNYLNFETVSLDVSAGKSVKLTGTTGGAQLNLYGKGAVDLSLPISGQNVRLVNASGYGFTLPGDSSSNYVQTGTTIINHGALTAAFDSSAPYGSAIQLDQLDRFTNDGSITLTQTANSYGGRASAINGGLEVVNKGEIVLNGGGAIAGAQTIINSGAIGQAAGGASAVGVSSVRALTNSGMISVADVAVSTSDYASSTIRNSGTIQSSAAQAIRSGYSTAVIVNEHGGTITGGTGFDAVALSSGGALSNAGTINGNVNLGYSPYGGTSGYSSAYVDRGGTLNGDLLFGSGDDIFVTTSDTLGVLGSIDAGDGIDTFARSYDASRTVDLGDLPALPTGFERQGIGASGSGTVVTLTASGAVQQPLTLIGDGTIVNLATISANPALPEPLLTLGSSVDPFNLSGAGSTLHFINRGTIGDGISGYAAGVENEGTIGNSGITAVQLFASNQDSFAFKNSGVITSADLYPFYGATGVNISSATDNQLIGQVSIANGGTIEGGLAASLNAENFSFSNDGDISRGNLTTPSVTLSLGQSYYSSIDINADSATISNAGTLGNGLNAVMAAKALSFTNSGTIGSLSNGLALSLIQSGHQTRDTTLGLYGTVDQESLTFTNSGTIGGRAAISSSATTVAATNNGTIGTLTLQASSQGNQTVSLANSARIGTDRLGASAVLITSDARSVEQQRTGFDAAAAPVDGEPTATIAVTNRGALSADGGASYRPATLPPYPWLPTTPETLNLVAALSVDASSGGVSSIGVTNDVGGIISATGATRSLADAQNPVVAGFEAVGSTAFVGIANQISLINAGTIRGLDGGMVSADISATLLGQNFAGSFLAGAIQTINSADTITNLATGVISGSVNLGALADRMANYGTINGNVYLGEGADVFIHGLRATQNGVVDGGTGTDTVLIDISGGGVLAQAAFAPFTNFERQGITGTGTITTNGPFSLDSLELHDAQLTLAAGQTLETASDTSIIFAGGTNSLVNLGSIAGSISFAGGTNSFVNRGSIAGPVTLASGSNSFTIGAGSSVGGPVIANGSDDLLILAIGGSDAAPQELRLSSYIGFERTRQDSGTIALSGDFTTGELAVAGGRFIGRTGSVLNAAAVLVGQGATFGSAGTVNGNIAVQGTLSPGSSPGTMVVNGNVALAGSSTTLFEMTPTISDALVINGALTIAPGATLKLVGNRPLTPGVTYQLIATTGGINGSFTAIDQASTVVGFIRQGNQSIDLLGQFVLGSGANRQVTQTVDYLNGLLIAGTATSGILAAAPSLLLADGTVNQATVARLNGESYASASQIGIENGLTIASALRTASTSAQGEEAGPFTFGQTLGGWRRLPGDKARGTSRANISTYGALAGIGFGTSDVSLGAFVGYIDARQQIADLQAKTEADGMLAGVMAKASTSGFNIAASLSYDGSKADTKRSLFGGSNASSRYRLRSWTADLSLGRAFALADDWTIEPEIGVTHISSRRGSASETGDAVWALDVEARRTKATFLRGAFELRGSAEARISPWLSAGVLHQLSGRRTYATAAYAGVSDGLTLAGVGRSETLATVGAGANLRVSPTAALFFGTNSEFGAESSGQSATIGYRLRF